MPGNSKHAELSGLDAIKTGIASRYMWAVWFAWTMLVHLSLQAQSDTVHFDMNGYKAQTGL
ncbi:MAG: hypothetical protein WBG48_14020, partial [Pricia sp.]